MDNLVFKKILDNFLIQKGFQKKSGQYYLFSQNIILVISFQKSSYSNSYYINLGYSFKSISENQFLKQVESHIKIRFGNLKSKSVSFLFELDKLSNPQLEEILNSNIETYLNYLDQIKLLKLIKSDIGLLNMTSLEVRNYLLTLDPSLAS
jgi:hypothetical protein